MKTYICRLNTCRKENIWARQNKNVYCRGNKNKCQRDHQDQVRVYDWLVKGITWKYTKNHPVPKWAKRELLKLQDGKCARCGLSKHGNGEEFVWEFEHIDGNPWNSVPKNCEVLCTHCHSKTPTYKRRDRTKVTQEQRDLNGKRIMHLLAMRKRKIEDLPAPTLH